MMKLKKTAQNYITNYIRLSYGVMNLQSKYLPLFAFFIADRSSSLCH